MPASAKVTGVQETMRTLKAVEPALQRQAVKDVKWAAEPIRAATAAAIPVEPPLSGMDHRGRTGWGARGARTVSTKYGGRRGNDRENWPLVSILVRGVGGSIYDMAGRGSTGSSLASNLSARYGGASRAAWPTAERYLPAVQAAVLKAVTTVSQEANVKLAAKGF